MQTGPICGGLGMQRRSFPTLIARGLRRAVAKKGSPLAEGWCFRFGRRPFRDISGRAKFQPRSLAAQEAAGPRRCETSSPSSGGISMRDSLRASTLRERGRTSHASCRPRGRRRRRTGKPEELLELFAFRRTFRSRIMGRDLCSTSTKIFGFGDKLSS